MHLPKHGFWLFIFCLCIGFTSFTNAKHQLQQIIENQYFIDQNYQQLPIKGIIIPTTKNDLSCHAFNTHKFLTKNFKYQAITNQTERTFYINKTDIRLLLLKKGYAKINYDTANETEKKNWIKIQNESIKQKLNIWKRRCNDKNISKKETFKTTVGTVKKVVNGNSFLLKDGPIIEILQTQIPEHTNNSTAAQCFKNESKKFLEHTILNKIVQLKPQNTIGSNPHIRVFRDVKILPTRQFKTEDLATIMIQQGYAKYKPTSKRQQKFLNKQQMAVYKNPIGAWSTCSPYVFGETNPKTPPSTISKPIVLPDPKCPVKGNISGSKKNPKKTYHTVYSGWYKRIKAETCFVDEREAHNSGFKKIK